VDKSFHPTHWEKTLDLIQAQLFSYLEAEGDQSVKIKVQARSELFN